MKLSKDFIQKMEKKLLEEKARLEEDIADFTIKKGKKNVTIFPEYGDHNGENASEVASYDNDLSVKNTLEKELRDIKKALKRIKDGTYGICKYCHKEISPQRLVIRPTSSACVACKKKLSGED